MPRPETKAGFLGENNKQMANTRKYQNPFKVIFRTEKSQVESVDQIAEKQGVSRTDVIIKAISNYVALIKRNN